jgi:hypothetical protein
LVATSDAHILSITPQRWFVPADGISRLWFKITLRDGNGLPLPGRIVHLAATLGDVTDGGMTDFQGQTFAYLTSETQGETQVKAVGRSTPCELVGSSTATVAFTAGNAESSLLPDDAAPYMNDGIEIEPLPIITGVPTTLRARLTNRNNFPILVDAAFSFAQLGIGLTFGPVGQVSSYQIAANSIGVIEIPWLPVVSGHYCFQFEYSVRTAAGVPIVSSGAGSAMRNVYVEPGGQIPPSDKAILEKAKQLTGTLSHGTMGADAIWQRAHGEPVVGPPYAIPEVLVHYHLGWVYDTYEKASIALGSDPPRQDYTTPTTLETYTYTPLTPGPDLPVSRAVAANAWIAASYDLLAKYRAASLSLDRAAGAAEAGNLLWSSQQTAAHLYYLKQSGVALLDVADRMDAYLQELRDEGFVDIVVDAAAIGAFQQQLLTQGFSALYVQAAHDLSVTDEEIEQTRQEILAADPSELAGSVMTSMADTASALRKLGRVFSAIRSPAAANVASVQTTPNNLIRVYGARFDFQVGNPLTQPATIDLRVRRLDLPPDWMVIVSPITATLAPGQQITATVNIEAGMAAVQGTQPRVAVEGYSNGVLLGGVVMDVLVPRAVLFDNTLHVFLPLVLGSR